MKLLILGGTRFLGRHVVDCAIARGHTLTTFTRGEHDDVLPAKIEPLNGDRDGNLTALEGRRWDAVIDTSGFVPRVVRAGVDLLSGAAERYAFISTISVYPDFPAVAGIDEESPVGTLSEPSSEDYRGADYGPLKALCEVEARRAFGDHALIIRPGLIVGPYDPTNRFTYWPERVSHGGETLAPTRPDLPVQFIDARDLADWTVHSVETGLSGTYNATGHPMTMGELLSTAKVVSVSDARFTWVSDAFLNEQGVGSWMELPLWAPETDAPGLAAVNCERAWGAGLTFRPLAETVRDTLAWRKSLPADGEWPAGLKGEREAQLLATWHAAQG
jgi:2'-hydroxyisoflavone reductase